MVRVIDHKQAPWFAAPDVCKILALANVSQAVTRLDKDEVTLISNEGSPGPALNIISEAGVYQLAFTSRKPVAHRFRRWLAHDVIPSIRKNGFYAIPDTEIIQPSPTEHRPFPDWPMEELRTKRGIVDMYRMLYGPMSAQWISPQMGFPPPPIELVEHGRQMKFALITPTPAT